jgi:phospholipase C
MTGQNIGNVLNAKNISWGWIQGGFAPTSTNSAGLPVCGAELENVGGLTATLEETPKSATHWSRASV